VEITGISELVTVVIAAVDEGHRCGMDVFRLSKRKELDEIKRDWKKSSTYKNLSR